MTVPGLRVAASDTDGDAGRVLTDFSTDQPDLGWYVVNDNVMGGRSEGGFRVEDGALQFAGRTNTDGGGFSSIRTKPVSLDLSAYSGIRLRLEGDGRRYTWRLTTDARWRGREVAYWADFDTDEGTWSTVDVPFSRFVPQFRGTRLDGPELNTGEITGMGLMIYDKRDGPFELRLASVGTYSKPAPFELGQYRWKHRVVVVSAPSRGDTNLAEVHNEVASRSDDFADRDMVLVTLLDDGASAAGDREMTAPEVDAARASLGIEAGSFALRLIGKDGTVKLSRDSAVSMTELFALIDTMPMRQREISDR